MRLVSSAQDKESNDERLLDLDGLTGILSRQIARGRGVKAADFFLILLILSTLLMLSGLLCMFCVSETLRTKRAELRDARSQGVGAE